MDNFLTLTTQYNNKKLTTEFKKIEKAFNATQKNGEVVARSLKAIKDNELWKDDFESFEKSIAVFGIGKAQAYRVINAITVKDEVPVLEDFTITQVAELARLENEQIEEAINNEDITKESTCKEIRKYVDSLKKALEAGDESEEGEGEGNDNEGEELPANVINIEIIAGNETKHVYIDNDEVYNKVVDFLKANNIL